jgi:hydroxymethylglutaryl-CoA synthase
MAVGIIGYGIYIPRYRIKREVIGGAWGMRGRGEVSVGYRDEDIITMGVEAALNAVEHSGIDSSAELEAIYMGTDSSDYIEHSSLGVIGEVLRVKEEIDVADFSGSPRSSVAAFKACKDAIEARRIRYGMVIGSEHRASSAGSQEEIMLGDGAAALILGDSSDDVIAEVEDTYTYSTNFVDRWRSVDSPFLREYEPRFTREFGYKQHVVEAVRRFLDKTGGKVEEYKYVVLQQSDPRKGKEAAGAIGVNLEQLRIGNLLNEVGDIGAGALFMGLAAVLDQAKAGERILCISYGTGTSDVIGIKVREGIEKKRERVKKVEFYLGSKRYIEDYVSFAKLKRHLKKEESAYKLGLPPASSALWRDGREIRQLNGAKCKGCGYVNHPPSLRKICIRCGGTEFEKVTLSRRGKVHTYCLNIYLPPPLEGPQPIIICDLDDGNRYRALGTEIKSMEELSIDMPVEIVLRKIITEDGLGVYGNVFRPLR